MALLGLCPLGNDMWACLSTPREMWSIKPVGPRMWCVLDINTMISKEGRAPFGGGVGILGGVDHSANSGLQNSF